MGVLQMEITIVLGKTMGIIEAFTHNTWLWFHMLGGGILAKFFEWVYWHKIRKYDSRQMAVLTVLFVAIAWEVLEYSLGIQAYGNDFKRFALDAFGDIMGAFIMAVIVVI